MAPTICSGKKRQTRTIATTNIRRHGQQGSHQLNQALSNIVNYVAKGSINPSLRLHADNQIESNSNTNSSNYIETSLNRYHTPLSTATNSRLRQQFSFISDNAVTSSTHSDTENTFDLRLANEIFTNNATTTTSLASSSSLTDTTENERTSSSTSSPTPPPPSSLCEERRFKRYSSIKDSNNTADNRENDVTDLYEDDDDSDEKINQIHSNNIRKHYYDYSKFDTEEDYNHEELEEDEERDLLSDISEVGSGSDMDTDEADSMTSLDTEKSAKLKRGNHPLLRDKLLAQQKSTNSVSNIRNTDGLLSIAIKTIKLVKRNQLLQQRLTQLQLETSEFIQSVLANPENRHFRENIKQSVQEVENV